MGIAAAPAHHLRSTQPCLLLPTGHYKNLRIILLSPIPRIYDEGQNGPQPLEEEARLLGANMDVEAIPKAAEEAKRRIATEVYEPLNEWMSAYRVICVSVCPHVTHGCLKMLWTCGCACHAARHS